jgi:hypothetical protein
MKKIQLVFAILAVAFASAGVFASKINDLAVTYHISANNGGTPCDTEVTPSCQTGTGAFCNSYSGGTAQVWVKNGSSCVELTRPM